MRKLSDAEIKAALAKPRKARKKKFDYGDRTYDGWFKIPAIWGLCDVPDHDGSNDKPHPIKPDEYLRGRMVVEIGDHSVCRFCFLDSLDIIAWGDNYWRG